jgi:hypothetical protein
LLFFLYHALVCLSLWHLLMDCWYPPLSWSMVIFLGNSG